MLLSMSMAALVSCSQDDNSENTNPQTPSGMVGPQFDMMIVESPAFTDIDKMIVNPATGVPVINYTNFGNGTPNDLTDDVYWEFREMNTPNGYLQVPWYAVMQDNMTVCVDLNTVPDTLGIVFWQHQWPFTVDQYTVDHPKVSYQINTTSCQPNDFVVFEVGENAQLTTYKVIRNFRGGAINLNGGTNIDGSTYTVVATGNVTQL